MGSLIDPFYLSLRDHDLEPWSKPVPKSKLDNVHDKLRESIHKAEAPKLTLKRKKSDLTSIASDDYKLLTLCRKPIEQRTQEDSLAIQAGMARLSPFFRLWPDALQLELVRWVSAVTVVQHEVMLTAGTRPASVNIVLSGKLGVCVRDRKAGDDGRRVMAELKRGASFGEAALLGDAKQFADIVVMSSTAVLLVFSAAAFKRTCKAVLGLRHQDRLMYLRAHPLMCHLPPADLDAVAARLHVAAYPHKEQLWPGPASTRVCFLVEGSCAVRYAGAVTPPPPPLIPSGPSGSIRETAPHGAQSIAQGTLSMPDELSATLKEVEAAYSNGRKMSISHSFKYDVNTNPLAIDVSAISASTGYNPSQARSPSPPRFLPFLWGSPRGGTQQQPGVFENDNRNGMVHESNNASSSNASNRGTQQTLQTGRATPLTPVLRHAVPSLQPPPPGTGSVKPSPRINPLAASNGSFGLGKYTLSSPSKLGPSGSMKVPSTDPVATGAISPRRQRAMYSSLGPNMVSILGRHDIFGVPEASDKALSRGMSVETLSHVKVYYITYEDYYNMPPSVTKALSALGSFYQSYIDGRAEALSRRGTRLHDAKQASHRLTTAETGARGALPQLHTQGSTAGSMDLHDSAPSSSQGPRDKDERSSVPSGEGGIGAEGAVAGSRAARFAALLARGVAACLQYGPARSGSPTSVRRGKRLLSSSLPNFSHSADFTTSDGAGYTTWSTTQLWSTSSPALRYSTSSAPPEPTTQAAEESHSRRGSTEGRDVTLQREAVLGRLPPACYSLPRVYAIRDYQVLSELPWMPVPAVSHAERHATVCAGARRPSSRPRRVTPSDDEDLLTMLKPAGTGAVQKQPSRSRNSTRVSRSALGNSLDEWRVLLDEPARVRQSTLEGDGPRVVWPDCRVTLEEEEEMSQDDFVKDAAVNKVTNSWQPHLLASDAAARGQLLARGGGLAATRDLGAAEDQQQSPNSKFSSPIGGLHFDISLSQHSEPHRLNPEASYRGNRTVGHDKQESSSSLAADAPPLLSSQKSLGEGSPSPLRQSKHSSRFEVPDWDANPGGLGASSSNTIRRAVSSVSEATKSTAAFVAVSPAVALGYDIAAETFRWSSFLTESAGWPH